ncbi:RNA polymerase factor sigma-54 [Teredinibacter sp. KSP-S5-2]|uniref:RNA polymerase factor sigma-54 n=1 Tax=Teredinibacter sp. KSP-S5-2 TaxID=3034506 RepID=UPI0029349311|nr:RNA polymerase factor sigma-54 [Teredinibacter sp. KSP-S5-2]WNO09586.1 RNA polymerase factor sigma-54 [Teredinibacter sp. KSP-S5-2]
MKQTLQLKMGQQLTMTPQLQQAIRLLQLSTLDLQAEIQEALDSNPMLETQEDSGEASQDTSKDQSESKSNEQETSERDNYDDSSATDSEWSEDIPNDLAVDTSWDDVYQSAPSGSGLSKPDNEDFDFESRRAVTETLQDHLHWQLNLTPMSDLDREIAEVIIDAVEPSGMLSQTADEIFEGIVKHHEELEMDEVIAVLHRVQQFDPVGVASQDIRECLMIQLSHLAPETEELATAKSIVNQYLELLGSRDFKQLMRRLKVKEPQLQKAIALIQSLNPRPGDAISTETAEYVVPDVFVQKENNRWQVQLNPEIAPKIRINQDYASLVKRADSSSDNTFLRDNLQEARWFLKSLQSRNETLLKVATCIVEKQQGFLDHGPEAMRPMVLHDVAEEVEMHESTISRVTTQKYMHTPQGIFELKYFFSSHVATDSGGECSSTAIRAIIKKLVAAENAKKPLSDSKITALLAEQGIKVARRTIAKYRESLGIPPSNERKRLV